MAWLVKENKIKSSILNASSQNTLFYPTRNIPCHIDLPIQVICVHEQANPIQDANGNLRLQAFGSIWQNKSPNGMEIFLDVSIEDHPKLRKAIVPAFSDQAVREQEPVLHEYMSLMIQRLKERQKNAV